MRPLIALLVFFALAGEANAAPMLTEVGHQDRHPTATFSGAETVYMATKPDRASDGSFLQENITDLDMFTDDEIASGRWLYEGQLDPGSYWLMATDYMTYSEPMMLEIPMPKQRFRGQVSGFVGISSYLKLTVTPLGESLPYKVCWTTRSGKRKCLRGEVSGYDWNEAASDEQRIGTRPTRAMRRTTRFKWYVDGKRVASKRAQIRR